MKTTLVEGGGDPLKAILIRKLLTRERRERGTRKGGIDGRKKGPDTFSGEDSSQRTAREKKKGESRTRKKPDNDERESRS